MIVWRDRAKVRGGSLKRSKVRTQRGKGSGEGECEIGERTGEKVSLAELIGSLGEWRGLPPPVSFLFSSRNRVEPKVLQASGDGLSLGQ